MSDNSEFLIPQRSPAVEAPIRTAEDFLPSDASHRPKLHPDCMRSRLLHDLREALAAFGVAPKDVLLLSGLGGQPDVTDFISAYNVRLSAEGVVAFAVGALRANPALTVAAVLPHSTGASLGSLVDAARKDIDGVFLVVNGGCRQRGAYYDPELLGVAGAVNSGFIARIVAGQEHSVPTLLAAFQRKGFAFVEVVGLCTQCGSENSADVPPGRGVLICSDSTGRPRSASPLMRGVRMTAEEKNRLWDMYQ